MLRNCVYQLIQHTNVIPELNYAYNATIKSQINLAAFFYVL